VQYLAFSGLFIAAHVVAYMVAPSGNTSHEASILPSLTVSMRGSGGGGIA